MWQKIKDGFAYGFGGGFGGALGWSLGSGLVRLFKWICIAWFGWSFLGALVEEGLPPEKPTRTHAERVKLLPKSLQNVAPAGH